MKLKILAFLIALTLATQLSAQTFTVLHSFTDASDGGKIYAPLILSSNTLYGTAYSGGGSGNGTVFRVNIDGSCFTNLHSFTIVYESSPNYPYTNADGAEPAGGMVLWSNTLYGTTSAGGTSGWGTVFKVNMDGSGFRTLHNFENSPDGAAPRGELTLSGNRLYGSAGGGGTNGSGMIFAINTDGSDFVNLYSFLPYYGDSEGSNPNGNLVLSGNTLYGTTYASNGGYYWGSVFKVNTDGSSFRTLHTFTDGSDGANPQAGLVLSGSTLYGTTSKGGTTNYVYDPVAGRGWSGYGTLFTISTDGLNFKNLYSFTNGSWGETAYGGVILSGSTLYGTTDVGEWGSVFAINTDGSEFMTLHAFAYNDGASPTASLILSGNILYGTTEFGGSNTTWGTVFALSLAPSAPTITTQPQSQTAEAGSNVAFSVVASGSPWPNYQWQFNGQNLAGQPAASLSLINVKFANAGGYLVIVTNAYGSVTSAVAQLTVFTNLVVVQTNEPPPPPGKPTIPTDATHFKVFTNGGFVTGIGLDPSKGAIVLTHGWKDSSSNWPLEMANLIKLELGSNTPNIVAWDWRAEANDTLTSATSKTLGQGYALGTNVVAALGANYSMRIHFIGHSLGTMVNAKAANIVHSLGFSWTNTQMTLFDEASVASGLMADSWQTATTLLQNDDNPQLILQPVLPAQCAWADNYITAFGLVHASAVNVILTNLYPVIDDTVLGDIGNIIWKNFVTQDTIYHNYPHDWYFNTVNQINNPNDPPYLMGFVRSWEGGGYAGRPSANTYYIESPNCPPSFPSYSGYDPAYNLVQISSDQASQFLNDRLKTILPQHLVSAVGASENVLANAPSQAQAMLETGQILDPAADGEFLLQYDAATIVRFVTTRLGGSLVQNGPARPQGGPTPKDGGMNSPAYVWITLSVPSSAVAMSFDFMLEGAGNQDSFQAALDNQNIFTLETVLIQTNVGMNSGMIGVSQYAGQEVQLFLGIVGGTSTNVTATVGNIMFYSAAPPTLQIQLAGTNIVLSWPLWAANYSLETKDKLGTANSWAVVTSVPSIVNSECTVTNQISRGSAFYRLAIIPPPVLHAQISGSSFVLSWPASGQNSSLQTTTNLTDANSWTTVTNVPAVLNQQNVVTNAMSGRMRFYRLKMQ